MPRHEAPDDYEYQEEEPAGRWSRGRSGGRRWLRLLLVLFVVPLLIGAGVALFAGRPIAFDAVRRMTDRKFPDGRWVSAAELVRWRSDAGQGPAGRPRCPHRRRVRRESPAGRRTDRPLQAEPAAAARLPHGHGDRRVLLGRLPGRARGGVSGAAEVHPGAESGGWGIPVGQRGSAGLPTGRGPPRRSIPTMPPGDCCWSRRYRIKAPAVEKTSAAP